MGVSVGIGFLGLILASLIVHCHALSIPSSNSSSSDPLFLASQNISGALKSYTHCVDTFDFPEWADPRGPGGSRSFIDMDDCIGEWLGVQERYKSVLGRPYTFYSRRAGGEAPLAPKFALPGYVERECTDILPFLSFPFLSSSSSCLRLPPVLPKRYRYRNEAEETNGLLTDCRRRREMHPRGPHGLRLHIHLPAHRPLRLPGRHPGQTSLLPHRQPALPPHRRDLEGHHRRRGPDARVLRHGPHARRADRQEGPETGMGAHPGGGGDGGGGECRADCCCVLAAGESC